MTMDSMKEHFLNSAIDELAERDVKNRDRIEALEAALREIVDGYDWTMTNCSNVVMPSVFHALIPKARAALASEQDK
jgi:hypothetical protein